MVSETVSRGREAGRQSEILAAGEPGRPRDRKRWVVLGLVVVLAAGVLAAWQAGVFSPAASSGAGGRAAPPATAAVTRQDLSAETPVTATLGYADSYPVTGQDGGTLTWLPSPGQVIGQGQALYRTGNGDPVVLLYGSVPDWRALSDGVTGQDVSELNHDLVALGYADRADVVTLGWQSYVWFVRYADGGGLTAEGRARRETVRLRGAEMFVRRRTRCRSPVHCVSARSRCTSGGGPGGPEGTMPGVEGPGGSACRLDEARLAELRTALEAGPAAHGWAQDQRWTLARAAALVARLFGVSYTLRGMSFLLHRIGYSPQVPVHTGRSSATRPRSPSGGR
jgi:hypothetical protein